MQNYFPSILYFSVLQYSFWIQQNSRTEEQKSQIYLNSAPLPGFSLWGRMGETPPLPEHLPTPSPTNTKMPSPLSAKFRRNSFKKLVVNYDSLPTGAIKSFEIEVFNPDGYRAWYRISIEYLLKFYFTVFLACQED